MGIGHGIHPQNLGRSFSQVHCAILGEEVLLVTDRLLHFRVGDRTP